jgi:carboxypeptidase C (cathepsin A)
MYETGPFVFWHDLDKTLSVNPYSWNNYLNVIYMESPAGVGWSLYNIPENLNADDYRTAHDNYFALQSFFNKFPEYKGRDFYITSESYGGIYGPSLTWVIHEWNKNVSSTQLNFINLKGFGILNGVVSTKYDVNNATPTYNWDHYMYGETSRQLYL